MAEIPSANVTVEDVAGAGVSGSGYLAIFAAVPINADAVPRVFASPKGLLSQHGYSPGASYVASHIEETRRPVVFCGLPIATPGVVGRVNSTGVTGSSAISVAAGANGSLEECSVRLRVTRGGTVGTSQIAFALSLDGGVTENPVRLGTSISYVIPNVGLTVNFGAGSLNVGDTFSCETTGPKWNGAGLTAARTALAAQKKYIRSVLVIGDLASSVEASAIVTEMNAYATANQRFTRARAQVRDRLPTAALSKVTKRMTGDPSLTFDATGKTITRAAGSWIADGYAVGDVVTVALSTSNNVTSAITVLTATVMTLGGATLVNEGPKTGCLVTGSPGLTFASGPKTITRTSGSWLADGFANGDSFTIAGTASNNLTSPITAITATVVTLGGATITAETIRSDLATITTGETKPAWVATMDAAYASVDNEKRIDLGLGRRRKKCPIVGANFRRPVQWAASLREYQHDVHIATWRKSDGPLSGWDSEDTNEYDELVDGGALAARFTCFRSWANGPNGAFIALSLTRAPEGSLQSRTHNADVVNLTCTVVQSETEMGIGASIVLKSDGTGSEESLALLEGRVNSQLQIALLQDNGEGPRASSAVWRASRSDILNIPGARLTGVCNLLLNGTLERIDTSVVVQTGG